MHTVTLNIQDNMYEHIMFLLKNLKSDTVEIVDEKFTKTTFKSSIEFETWSGQELQAVGKIGFNSKSFIEDDEDYSRW